MTTAPPFDVTGPLPRGVTVLEASAGTGKTYTITALAARYVAEGTPLHRLLLVTFTRMATGELRERVRDRLVSVERELGRVIARAQSSSADPVVEHLSTSGGDPREVVRRRDRLTRALADFDAATIATTHGFCQEVLEGLGIAGDVEPNVQFVEDVEDLIDEVIDDLYVRRFHGADAGAPPFDRKQAAEIARMAIYNPAAPVAAADGGVAAMRRRLAISARDELERRKRRTALMTYDDLLTRLYHALHGDRGALIAARLRARYEVVLVDEFQDTDPIQWGIMERAFAADGRTLILIADPKQAIYAFRGADVYAYLEAARSAQTHATLAVNYRSDQPLIDAYDALFDGARLGHEGIVYGNVSAAPPNRTSRLLNAPHPAPVRIRIVNREACGLTRTGYAQKNAAQAHIAQDLAADLVALLSAGASIELRDPSAARTGQAAVNPGHVAVLVRTNKSAALIRDALERAGIPAVINGAGSVFATREAGEWLRLLDALERPTSTIRAHAAALTCFFGWSAERVAAASEQAWSDVHRRLHEWAEIARERGIASLLEAIAATERLPARMLAAADGERRITDLRHVGQLLHGASAAEQLGLAALTAWLRRRIAEAGAETADEDRSRRLESDADAVQVLTIHRSKGLEFPIVYLPFLWDAGRKPDDPPVFFHDPDAGDARTIDVALTGADYRDHKQLNEIEERGEELRLAYVALTRARHQAVVWWAGSYDSRHSPLARLLFERGADGTIGWKGRFVPSDADARKRFDELAARAPGRIGVEPAAPGLPVSWAAPQTVAEQLEAARFERSLDERWRRTSYSDITAGTYEARVGSEPDEPLLEDERDTESAYSAPPPPAAQPSPLAAMGSGTAVGTVIHRVLEAVDFAAADLDAELDHALAEQLTWRSAEVGERAAVVAGLKVAIETPLGPVLDGRRLRDFARRDRLDELTFELPLVGGDEPSGTLIVAQIGELLQRTLPAADSLYGYASALADPGLRRDVRGYLTGSLDLVVRFAAADGTPRYAVLDYKTNWLGDPDEELTLWHYRPEALAAEMRHGHYGLQALLYAVALHRYLRWRQPGYDPERNFAGVLYLFLRGMAGEESHGVFSWQPPATAVHALSDLLDKGMP
jgi:exodeoxyribonuclease V beta subunit